MKRPLRIGLSACFFYADPQRAIFKGKTLLYFEESMIRFVQSSGALVFGLPRPPLVGDADAHWQGLLSNIDGLVLQGGSDVCPKSYGEDAMRPEWMGDYERDVYEIELLRQCVAHDKPVLGICRGLQLINVAFGGTLYQDIETQVPKAGVHRDWTIYDQLFHEVEIVSQSTLAGIYPDRSRGVVNSVHHQAIKDLGNDLRVEALSRDGGGLVEAIALQSMGTSPSPYVVGVQWHPEFQDTTDARLLPTRPLLDHFLAACSARASAST